MPTTEATPASNFIRNIITDDVQGGRHPKGVATRFPPEPNGYLHIGHAKSICLNFGMADAFEGRCNLRFDDTNPGKESDEYVEAIKADVSWLGFQWDELHHASDYFDDLYEFAIQLIQKKLAYVDSSTAEEMRALRGTLTEPGQPSPYRDRSVEENLDLFARMKAGEFDDGTHVLRAKIDMSSGNINLRDPTLYRIRKIHHMRTGDAWSIYPMYDYTHCVSDALEGITHSLCTLEFEDHRPLYDWVLDSLSTDCHPQQIEFARLSLEYTILSKRRLIQLVEEGHVSGWDDPRMPTIIGMRRRGFPPAAIRTFCDKIGVTKNDAWIEMAVLETCVRDELNVSAPRRMAVLNPVKVTLTDLPTDHEESLIFQNHPNDEGQGTREVVFSSHLYIDADDFSEDPPKGFQRLVPGGEVRLRGSYIIRCDEVVKDASGAVTELRCTHDPDTLGKKPEGRKVKGVIHWISASQGIKAEVRLFDRLFNVPHPGSAETLASALNPESSVTLHDCLVDSATASVAPETVLQFERTGYFAADRLDHTREKPVFNRTITLRDTWASS